MSFNRCLVWKLAEAMGVAGNGSGCWLACFGRLIGLELGSYAVAFEMGNCSSIAEFITHDIYNLKTF